MWRTRLLLLLVFMLFLSSIASAQVKWVKYINPTSGEDYGYGTCLFGDYLVVVGEAGGSPFLALLDRESGEVVKTWSRGSGWFFNCVAVGDKLYVVGRVWEVDVVYRIYVFDINLNVVSRIQVDDAGFGDIIYQDGYFYIGGYKWKNFSGQFRPVWYIERRRADLGLVAYREIFDADWRDSGVVSVGVNPVTGDVWAVGYYKLGGVWRPLVAVLDRDLNLKRLVQLSNYTGFFGGVCFDNEGNAYVDGNDTVTKFDKNGDYVKRYDGGGRIVCVKDRVYLFGRVNRTAVTPVWQLVYSVIDTKTMERIRRADLPASSTGDLTNFYAPGKLSFDGRYVYAAGALDLSTGGGSPIGDTEIVVFAVPVVSTVRVVDSSGRPLAGFVVRAVAGNYSLVNSTGADGVTSFWGLAPDAVYVYDEEGLLVGYADGNVSQIVVRRVGEVRAANSVEAHGYAVFKGLFLNGTVRSLVYEVAVSGGAMRIQRPIPSIYPVEVYVDEVSVGALRLKLEKPLLVYRGNASDLAKGLDFAELGLTSLVSVQAVDSTGSPRRDWAVQLIYGNVTVAEGRGTLTAVLPRTSVLGQPYVVKVVTTALTPEGSVATREQLVAAVGDWREVRVAVSTARVTVFAVDGFGQPRDWPVEIENVARGVGYVSAELLEGAAYTAKVAGLGFTNVTKFVARGPEMSVAVKIPTARLTARVIDGFGNVRSDWPVEVVGVVSGQGSVSAEVLAGKYTVRAVAFGREFVEEVAVAPGQDAVASVQVPTARLSVYVVDEYMRLIDRYVTLVEVSGPVAQFFSEPPRDLEVLAGLYFITVTALGKRVSTSMTLHSGDYVTVRVLVPGAAGIDVGGTRITYPTLYTILGVAVAVAVVGLAVAKLRSRGKGH